MAWTLPAATSVCRSATAELCRVTVSPSGRARAHSSAAASSRWAVSFFTCLTALVMVRCFPLTSRAAASSWTSGGSPETLNASCRVARPCSTARRTAGWAPLSADINLPARLTRDLLTRKRLAASPWE